MLDLHDLKVPKLTKDNKVLDTVDEIASGSIAACETINSSVSFCCEHSQSTVSRNGGENVNVTTICPSTLQHSELSSDDNHRQTGCSKSIITASETVLITSPNVGNVPCKIRSDSFSSVSVILDPEQRCCEDMQSCGSRSWAQGKN